VFKLPWLKKPDFSLVLLIIVALAFLFLMTFELWVSHEGVH
jgi:hypothetical protein